jgi:tetratricopeptide (TPR) repeat protein
MEAAELQQKLKDGISAIRGGDRERGRALLLQVVGADDRIEPAWLWLSAAVDDPADKLVALENVLVLNPNNAQAQAQVRSLREQLGIAQGAPPPEQASAPERAAPARLEAASHLTPLPGTSIDFDDDPYQCAYCGRLTHDTDNACPHCGRNLLVWGKWGGGSYQYALLLLCGLDLQVSFVEAIGPSIAIGISKGIDPSTAIFFSKLPMVTALLGDFLNLSGSRAVIILTAAVVRCALWLGLTYLFYNDVESAFAVAIGVTLLDAAWTGVGYWMGFLGPGAAMVNLGLAGLILLFTVPAVMSRSQARVRLRVDLDRDARSAAELYKHGRKYQQKGQWALAALHWRRATVLNPNEPLFYQALGLAQMELGRYPQALATLSEGARRAPNDAEFKTLIEAARAKAQKK